MCSPREVLLVGEGNFSFSAALLESSMEELHVTSTCLQSEDEALRMHGTQENIQHLRDCGSTVLFEVDCTCLSEHEDLHGHLFDCIIFNFPHFGRKSGVKKNRGLLVKFFQSCAKVLKDGGEVHVALCNGQGGTPADNPMREWHNSWQVVAMAAEAGLVLNEVHPFDPTKYQGYKCTGYRSQDKGFHVENGLNHIFTRSYPYTTPVNVKMEAALAKETILFELPAELSEYVNRSFLDSQSCHPVKLVQEQLLRELKSSWPVNTLTQNFPELVCCPSDQLCAFGTDLVTTSQTDIYWVRSLETHGQGSHEEVEGDDHPSANTRYALQPSLLVHLSEIINHEEFSPGTLHTLSGLVFRRTPVSPNTSPAHHQLLLVGALPSDSEPLKCLHGCLETLLSPHGVSFREDPEDSNKVWLNSDKLPKFGRLAYLSAPEYEFHSVRLCVVTIDLDHLATLVFGLFDWRLLWSPDPRFLRHFSSKPLEPFAIFSLYPSSYSHDISFWMEPDSFDELDFHAVIRQATAGAVKDVVLVDRFRHPHMGHASLCYRLTYQSPDRALSHSQVKDMHVALRKLMAQKLRVTLR
ncbi:ferredoxin-fold anticodon-binding domain-containing protein 1 isoform X2 [Engraulis encrasicolus]